MEPISFIVLVFFICFVAFIVLFKSYFSDRKERKGSANYSSSMDNFYYLLETNKEYAIDKLTCKSISNNIDYTYDEANSELVIDDNGSELKFKLLFFDIQGYVYMVACLKSNVEKRSHIPNLINSFLNKKINATTVEAFYFEALSKNYDITL